MGEMDIFDLSIAKEESKFVKQSLQLELEVAADILDTMKDIPWLGPLIKLGQVGKGFLDLKFVLKIGRFLKQSEDIEPEKKEAFVAGLNKKERKRMYDYLMNMLYSAEEDRKADVMGLVYRDRIMNNINNDIFLRLCSSISRVYIEDINRLEEYVKPVSKSDYISNNLYSSGFLRMTEPVVVDGTYYRGGQFELNEVGQQLLRIIKNE